MLKIYKICLLFLAVLLIVLHNVTPHTHEMSGQEAGEISKSGIDNSLLIDLGGDHLGAFSRCHHLAVEKNTLSDSNPIIPIISWLEYSDSYVSEYFRAFPLYHDLYQEDRYLNSSVSRGPPTLS